MKNVFGKRKMGAFVIECGVLRREKEWREKGMGIITEEESEKRSKVSTECKEVKSKKTMKLGK